MLFGLAVTFLPALGLWFVEMAVRLVLGVRPAARVHLVFIVVLVAVFVMQAARPLGNGIPLVVGAILLGVGAGVAYARFPAVHLWLAFAALAPLGFLVLFLTSSSTSRLLRAEEAVPAVEVGSPAPVVMVVLDELPLESLLDSDRGIDRELYPNIAALADDSHWFRNTTTVSTSTWHAVPAIMTGQMPAGRQPADLGLAPRLALQPPRVAPTTCTSPRPTRACALRPCAPSRGVRARCGGASPHDVAGVARDRLSPTRSGGRPRHRVRGAEQPRGRLDLRLPRCHPARAVPLADGQPR